MYVLWADIMRMAWSLKLVDLVHETSNRIIDGTWDVTQFKEIVILQVEACYTKAQCYVQQVANAAPDLFEGAAGVDGLSPKALGLISGNDVPLQPRFLKLKVKVMQDLLWLFLYLAIFKSCFRRLFSWPFFIFDLLSAGPRT